MAALVLVMVFLSGLTGLMYQVTWHKYLSIYLGSHALSTSLTLSVFFLFLAFGYHLFGRFGHRLGHNRILTYGYVEAIIGVYAIASPTLFNFLYEIWPNYPTGSTLHILSSAGFALLLMGLPTFLMGGTIPLLTQGLSEKLEESHKIHAYVYGLNTFGAVVGTLLAGFYFLESFGLEQTLNLTGIINCLICIFLIVYCKLTRLSFSGYEPPQEEVVRSSSYQPQYRLLTIAFLSGLLSFGLESLMIRMAGISIGSSEYTYTVIVASFIVSIAFGSILASKISEEKCLKALIATQGLLIVSLLILYLIIPKWPDFFMRVRAMFSSSDLNFTPYWIVVFTCFFLFLAVPVTLLGMTLPLLFQQLKSRGQFLNQTAGKMYSYNSIGATFGAILLGYLMFLFLSGDQIFAVLILLSTLSFLLVLDLKVVKNSFVFRFGPILAVAVFMVIMPGWEDYNFVPSRFFSSPTPFNKESLQKFIQRTKPGHPEGEKIIYSNFGVNTYTVVTEDPKGDRSLFVNGKPDASTSGDKFTRTLTALIPLTLAEKNEDIFIVGLGTGMSAGIATSFQGTKKVKVAEIASGVIDSLPYFSKWNFGLDEKLDQVEIINDDAYKVLRTEEQTYDLIFSEPSNTWVTGVEKIYTPEFLNQAAQKLRPHGIYSQWFPLFAMTEESLLSILANFKSSFEHVTLWSAGGNATVILASHQALSTDLESLERKTKGMTEIYNSIQKESAQEILYHQIWSDPAVTELANSSQLSHSLYQPSLAYQSGRAYFYNNSLDFEELAKKYFLHSPLEENLQQDNGIKPVGPDKLLWQEFAEQLPKSFYEKALAYTMKVHPMVAGKVSLAKVRFYPDDDQKMIANSVNENQLKTRQFMYLLGNESEKKLKPSQEKAYLAQELFSRYLYLRSMREPAELEKVLVKVPDICDINDQACFKLKFELLLYLKGKKASDDIKKMTQLFIKKESEALRMLEIGFREASQKL